MDPWVQAGAAEMGRRAVRELEALVAVSSPSGDVHGAEECAAVCAALLPDEAESERIPCSSPGHAPDLLARLTGTGGKRILLLGHLDTVVPHAQHRPLSREGEKLVGSGSVDMKGGVVLSIGAMRALAARPGAYAEVALLLVCDEEWRTGSMAWSCGARRRGRSASPPAAAPRTPARRPTGGATRCSRWPPPRRPSPAATTRRAPTA